MTVESWDAAEGTVVGPWDEALEGCRSIDRYGVLGREERDGEPLDVALQQEEDDVRDDVDDDEWLLVDDRDDRPPFLEGQAPEERAMHVVES